MKSSILDRTSHKIYEKSRLILILIGFQFFITGCGQGFLFSGRKGSIQEGSSSGSSTNGDYDSGDSNNEQTEPSVRVIEYPRDHPGGGNNQIVFEVLKGESGIVKVECFVDGIRVPCGSGKNTIDLGNLDLGQHQIQIIVTDEDGRSGQFQEDWYVYNPSDQKRHNHNLHATNEKNKIDILFVIDNSGSMAVEQRKISQRFTNFIDRIRGFDWRMGMTTTDPRLEVPNDDHASKHPPWITGSDGRLVLMSRKKHRHNKSRGYYYLTPAIGDAQEIFSESVQREATGSGSEQGLRATYRAIQRATANDTDENRILNKFFRHEAALAVVVVSDENESGGGIKNTPDELIDLVKKSFGQNKVFQFHSIIAHTSNCIDKDGESYGYRYETMSKKTGGIIGDICSDNYSEILSDIGHGVSNLKKTYEMRCTPQSRIVDFRIVAKNPDLGIPDHTIDGLRLQFDRPLDPGDYEVTYHCLAH